MGDADPIATLTEKQRECLRMVLQHHSSKEIARELGIGVDAVDQRIKAAMRKLGVNSRLEAARMLAQQEEWLPAGTAQLVPQRAEARSRLARLAGYLLHLLPQCRRRRFVLWACLVSILFGLPDAGAPVDDLLRDWNNRYHRTAASGDIAFIEIDERSTQELGPAPWPRDRLARMVDRLSEFGAERVAMATVLDRRNEPEIDRKLASAFGRFDDRLALPVEYLTDPNTGIDKPIFPLPEFRRRAFLCHGAAISRLWTARRIQFHLKLAGRPYPSISSELAEEYRAPSEISWAGWLVAGLRNDDSFPIDYSIDPRTIPRISAVDLLNGHVAPDVLAGKSILVGGSYSERMSLPNYGEFPGEFIFLLGAETLKAGPPIEIAWPIPLFFAMLIVALSAAVAKPLFSTTAIAGAFLLLLVLLRVLDAQLVFIHASPALFLLLVVGVRFASVRLIETRRTRKMREDAVAVTG